MAVLVAGTFRLPPDRRAAAEPAMAAMIAESRAEDGCLDYAYAYDVAEPSLVRVFERWRDRESLARHFRTRHIADWRAAWPTLGITDRDLKLQDAGEPEPLLLTRKD